MLPAEKAAAIQIGQQNSEAFDITMLSENINAPQPGQSQQFFGYNDQGMPPGADQHRRETANFRGNKDERQSKQRAAKASYNTVQGSGQGSSFGYASKGN